AAGMSFEVVLTETGNYELRVSDGAMTATLLIGPARTYMQHIAVTYDGTTLSVYRNGDLVDAAQWTWLPDAGFDTLTLGWDNAGVVPYTGVVDEVQIADRAF